MPRRRMRLRHLLFLVVVGGLSLSLLVPGGILLGANGGTMYLPSVYNQVPTPTATPDPGWHEEYFNNPSLTGTPVFTRSANVAYPDYEWGEGAPIAGMPADNFSARFTRTIYFDPGTYEFILTVDDGGRLFIDGQAVIDEFHGSVRGVASYVHRATFTTGSYHQIRVEYFEALKEARVRAFWINKDHFPEWRAEYFNNETLSGAPALVRNETDINHVFGEGSPAPNVVTADHFSARYTRAFYLDGNGAYVFRASADDGVLVWIDNWAPGQRAAIDLWEGQTGKTGSSLEVLPPGWYVITVHFREAVGHASLSYQQIFGGTHEGLRTEYFANETLTGNPVVVRDEFFDQLDPYKLFQRDWGTSAPVSGIPADAFSVRWLHAFEAGEGDYRFTARADDGVRIWVDDAIVLDRWLGFAGEEHSQDVTLRGTHHVIRVEYHDVFGGANVRFFWQRR